MRRDETTRVPVSIVCVYNAPDVLASCLERSVAAGRGDAPQTELIAVDNRAGQFATAGAALNHGARQARNPVVAFVHQDVFLHSVPALERAAATLLATPQIGVLGAVGIDGRGTIVGRIRDRLLPLGVPAPLPSDVDTMDEVLFMVSAEQLAREPLADDPLLGWHAYAVEYSLRMRRAGRRAVVQDIPLTHNSLTTNLRNLDVAHHRVAETYPELLPARTTCGTLHRPETPAARLRLARRARGARTLWGESVVAWRVSRATDRASVVLADIRFLIDEAASLGGATSVRALDLADGTTGRTDVDGLERFGLGYSAASVSLPEAEAELRELPEGAALVVAGLTVAELAALKPSAAQPTVVGYTRDGGLWLLAGCDPARLAPLWSGRRQRPFAGIGSR
ncbi:hypothetical protein Xcel_2699 [Xylanimonas cellulosilytica DSM 15894]|uniref:Glycosyl transferase family 2 n=1 Tax=Xylanimonas cellulosilytica (strain DSM 15894 / JCM 12276 / CECT 5975 / KCTC 9989 / LMG 20990 / NBRC 107835 / XIL07) TaxID=446471 RepID=D1BXS2_XYLCX|nr:glycosyltransferase [Xylanimonas cellulosilytica]ACZ31713.1 hypothetical protein Xcel_2699 [Xylanimonas cellulosilytica DSM 15894]